MTTYKMVVVVVNGKLQEGVFRKNLNLGHAPWQQAERAPLASRSPCLRNKSYVILKDDLGHILPGPPKGTKQWPSVPEQRVYIGRMAVQSTKDFRSCTQNCHAGAVPSSSKKRRFADAISWVLVPASGLGLNTRKCFRNLGFYLDLQNAQNNGPNGP